MTALALHALAAAAVADMLFVRDLLFRCFLAHQILLMRMKVELHADATYRKVQPLVQLVIVSWFPAYRETSLLFLRPSCPSSCCPPSTLARPLLRGALNSC